jgi:hypothetical protein
VPVSKYFTEKFAVTQKTRKKISDEILESESTSCNLPPLPQGIPCMITIEHISNLQIAPGRLICVSLETQEGQISTEWRNDGVFNFQKSCLLIDPLPEVIVFHLYSLGYFIIFLVIKEMGNTSNNQKIFFIHR